MFSRMPASAISCTKRPMMGTAVAPNRVTVPTPEIAAVAVAAVKDRVV